jgi:hypothetical protein
VLPDAAWVAQCGSNQHAKQQASRLSSAQLQQATPLTATWEHGSKITTATAACGHSLLQSRLAPLLLLLLFCLCLLLLVYTLLLLLLLLRTSSTTVLQTTTSVMAGCSRKSICKQATQRQHGQTNRLHRCTSLRVTRRADLCSVANSPPKHACLLLLGQLRYLLLYVPVC